MEKKGKGNPLEEEECGFLNEHWRRSLDTEGRPLQGPPNCRANIPHHRIWTDIMIEPVHFCLVPHAVSVMSTGTSQPLCPGDALCSDEETCPERLADLLKASQLAGDRKESLTLSHSGSCCVPNPRTTSPFHLPFQASCQWVVPFWSLVISGPSCHLPCALGRVTPRAQCPHQPLLHSDPSSGW